MKMRLWRYDSDAGRNEVLMVVVAVISRTFVIMAMLDLYGEKHRENHWSWNEDNEKSERGKAKVKEGNKKKIIMPDSVALYEMDWRFYLLN